MASSVIADRIKKIDGLKCFIKSVEERVKAIANELNWNYEELTGSESSLATCSIHPEHRVGTSRIKEHEENCRWLRDGYHKEDVAFPEFHGQGSCVVFTPELQERVIENASLQRCNLAGETSAVKTHQRGIPQTSSRFDVDFSREEKLALYDYVVANTEKQNLCKDLTILAGKEQKAEEKLMTPLEIAAAERDAKRRRASYRNKVHTNRKTQTEILREVIESQMETLAEEMSLEKDSKERCPKNEERQSCTEDSGYSKKSREYDGWRKFSDYNRDYRRSYSDRDDRGKDRYSRDGERHKSKKHKRSRSRSRSRSRDRLKYKKSRTHGSHSGYVRH